MSDTAVFAQGIELRLPVAGTMTAIPGVMSITGPGKSRDTVEVTSHSSPDSYREFIGGLRDGGELTFDMNEYFGDPAQLALEAEFDADIATDFEMLFPRAVENNLLTFSGFVTATNWNGPIDAQVTRPVTIKVTGPIERDTE